MTSMADSVKSDKYGMRWPTNLSFAEIEMEMIRRGGRFQLNGQWYGNGLFYHYRELESLLWPKEKVWHKWNELQLKSWLDSRTMVVLGPSSSGKTNTSATDHLADFYCFPHETTIIVCSTTAERLQDRIFGEIKRYHRMARERFPWLPGEPIDSRMRIVTETVDEAVDGRDVRSGIVGVACLQGGQYKGIGSFIGIKNRRVRVVMDELQMLPPAILLAMSNLDKNPDFKGTGLGNPKDTTDALGVMAEPSFSLGGWDGGIDQAPNTKTWPTRRPDGICVQLVGTDSPNLDGKLGIPLISQADIDRDVAQYGKDSLQFSMMNQGMMPKGQGSRRVITRQFCHQNKAMEKAIWLDSNRIRFASLDAAFKGVGGDRCVLMFFEMGFEPNIPEPGETNVGNLLNQTPSKRSHNQVISIEDMVLVPIDIASPLDAEDQIVLFCKEQCLTRRVPASNFFYESGMRASLVSAFGRLWSVDTNPIDCGGPASERQVSGKIEMPCNKYYSKLVTEFWFSVRLVIEAKQLRGLTESVMDEGCKREWKMVAGNKIEVEPKKDMKEKIGKSPDLFDCFVGTTLVTLERGRVPIKDVTVGDMALTPFGYFPVVSTHHQVVDSTCNAEFSNGEALCGKPGHRVFEKNLGWSRMDSLSLTNECESEYDLPVWNILNLLFTKEENIGFKQLADIIKTKIGTVSRSDFYTELYGKRVTGIFLEICASITKMVSGGITGLRIWNWLSYASMLRCTLIRGCPIHNIALNGLGINTLRLAGRLNGTGLQRVLSGIGITPLSSGSPRRRLNATVLNAAEYSTHLCPTAPDSVPRDARTFSGGGKLRVIKEFVLFVAQSLLLTNTKRRSIVPATVRVSLHPGKREVFNIGVAGPNVYYANGILVENCLSIGVEGARRLGFYINNKVLIQQPEKGHEWKKLFRKRAMDERHQHSLNHTA